MCWVASATLRTCAESLGSQGEEALAWITSHSFRKTTATILDDAASSARLVGDQLGHARPSITQDVYMGRRAVDTQRKRSRWR